MRDVDELKEISLPIWAQFIRAQGATKTAVGALNAPVEIGGTVVHSKDIIIMDRDGATCVPLDQIDDVLEKAEARLEREVAMRKRLLQGEMSFDIHGLRKLVEL